MTDTTALLTPGPWHVAAPPDAPTYQAAQPPVPQQEQESPVTIHCAGIDFVARHSMAVIFLRRALELVAAEESGSVPLLHSGGLDLLLITPTTAVACLYNGWTLTGIHSLREKTSQKRSAGVVG